MKRKLHLIFIYSAACLLLAAGCQTKSSDHARSEDSGQTTPWSVRMTDSDIKRNPEGWMLDFSKKPKWNYCHGLVCSAIEQVWYATGDEKYYHYIKDFADTMINEQGEILTYRAEEYNIDRINSGKFLFALYEKTRDEKYKKAIIRLRDQMRTHPRTAEGGFWHKKIYPHQMWLDGLYMASPFLAQYAREFNEPELFDDVANQIHLIDKYTLDEVTGLYYHGWDESREQRWADKETGLSRHVWGRGMGWYAMTLVDVLDFFPENHKQREMILEKVEHMADVLIDYQDEETGLWYQVMDQAGREGNYLESSASTMFVYFLVKAVKHDYIDKSYLKHARKGYQGILEHFIVENEAGEVEITRACAGAGLGGDPYRDGSYEYYINEKIRANDPKAVGPFIMAALLFEELDNVKYL